MDGGKRKQAAALRKMKENVNTYTKEYGFFGGEKELYNQLMEMCENDYFPDNGMNEYIQDYLEEGGNPYLLGILPEDFGFVLDIGNAVGYVEEVNNEWAKELGEGQKHLYDISVWAGNQVTGTIVEYGVAKGVSAAATKIGDVFDSASDAARASDAAADAAIVRRGNTITGKTGSAMHTITEAMKADDALQKGVTAYVVNGAGSYNDGIGMSFEKGYGLKQSDAFGITRQFADFIINYETGPIIKANSTKAALEAGINNVQTKNSETWFGALMGTIKETANNPKQNVKNVVKQVVDWKIGDEKTNVASLPLMEMTATIVGEPVRNEEVKQEVEDAARQLMESGRWIAKLMRN